MHIIQNSEELKARFIGQKVTPPEIMSPNFDGVSFDCGCGKRHPASTTPHIACGRLNEFFHICSGKYVTFVKYKGFFGVKAVEHWSCPAQIFNEVFFESEK